MQTARVQLVPAWVLSRRPYRESSLLLDVLAEGHGRVGLVARGSRGSRRGQPLALLQRYRLSWSRRGELGTVTAHEADGPPLALRGETILWVWYVNELLLRALQRDDDHPALYSAYERVLVELAAGADDAALRRFEQVLGSELGFGLGMADGDPAPGQRYRYVDGEGMVADVHGPFSAAALKAILAGDFRDAATRRAARDLFQAQLPQLIGERPLRTPALLRRLRARTAGHADSLNRSGDPTNDS